MTPASPSPPEPRATVGRLDTLQAFRRFVARVTECADRWLALLGVHPADRDDVWQEALLQMYKRRGSYDPELGSWEDWAFGYVGTTLLNYRRSRRRRILRVDVALNDLPDIAIDSPNAEEGIEAAMRQRLFERCMANLDPDSRAILLARAEGRAMSAIAVALGVSLATAYRYHDAARDELQAALDRAQNRKRALGLAVLPLTIDQLISSDSTAGHLTAETMGRIWKTLDRAMAADVRADRLGDDGTEVPRYLGSPSAAPRPRLAARILRALLDPRVSHAFTSVVAAAGGAFVTYEIMRPTPESTDASAEFRTAAKSALGLGGYHDESTPTDTAARSAGAVLEPELRGDAGAHDPSAPPTARANAANRDDIGEEKTLFDRGMIAYNGYHYLAAIKAFQDHARNYPRGEYAGQRERFLILSLIRVGRKPEAREKVERLRQFNPESPTVKEVEAALRAAN